MANKNYDLAHTKWMCKYHIVFTPKYRRKIIYNQLKSDIRDILKQLCSYKGVEILEGHLMPDHIHLGCGSGIYSELLYDKGFSVTGIDFSKRSIKYAQNYAIKTTRKIQYHYQDYLEIDYEREFDIAILIYCDFGVLSPQNRNVLLKKIHKALKKDGILILDVFHTPYLKSFHTIQNVQYEKGGFWSVEPHVVIQRNKYYEETGNTLEQYLIITDNDCECFNIWNQIYSQKTFTEELKQAGFIRIGIYDDVKGASYTGQAETICGIFRNNTVE